MTRVRMITRRGRCVGFTASGHTGFAERGHDIVCAAVSALTQTCELGLSDVLGLEPVVARDDERGAYVVRLPRGVRKAQLRRAQLLFRTLYIGLKSIEAAYPDCVRVNANDRRWN